MLLKISTDTFVATLKDTREMYQEHPCDTAGVIDRYFVGGSTKAFGMVSTHKNLTMLPICRHTVSHAKTWEVSQPIASLLLKETCETPVKKP